MTQFALNEDQMAVRDMARDFAAEKIAPHALRWDEEKHFPVDVMREAARPMTLTRSSCSTISMRREFSAIRKTRRRKTGTAPSRY